MPQKFLNQFSAVLTTAVTTAGQTSWFVSAANATLLNAESPSATAPIRLQVRDAGTDEPAAVDCEWVDVTAANGGTGELTVVRGAEGTAQTWAIGDELRCTDTAGWQNDVRKSVSQFAAVANNQNATDQTIATATQTKVTGAQLGTVIENTSGLWSVANNRFEIAETGIYLLTGNATYAALAQDVAWINSVWVNGALAGLLARGHSATASEMIGGSGPIMLSLTAGDYVELYTYHSSGTNKVLSNQSFAAGYTTFSILRVG